MKHFTLTLIFCALSLWKTFAQTVLFSDDFSNQNIPDWTIVNHYPNSNVLWKWSNTGTSQGDVLGEFNHPGAANGHMIVDSDFDGDPNGNIKEYTTLTSRAIDCSSAGTVVLYFVQYYLRFSTDTLQVLVSTDSVNWTSVYSPTATVSVNQETQNPQVVEINITSLAANKPKVHVRFSWKSTWGYWWFLDDVKLLIPPAHDLRATDAFSNFTNGCQLSNAEIIRMRVANKGTTPVTSFTAHYSVNNGPIVTENVNLSTPLAFDSTYLYTFSTNANLNPANAYEIYTWVTLPNDAIVTNDTAVTLSLSVNPASPANTPYTMGFEVLTNELDGFAWEVIDANNDGFSWFLSGASPNGGNVHYRYSWNTNGTTAANDWLISTCMDFDATKAYKLSFYCKVGEDQSGLYEEKLRVRYGNARTATAMTQNIFDFGILDNSTYEQKKAAFKPATSGTYYVGFHCYSDADKWRLDIDDIKIELLPPPTANFSTSVSGSTVSVTDASEEFVTNWEWHWGDGQTSTGKNPGPHTYTTGAGTYEICLIVTNLAGKDTLCKNITITGLPKTDLSDAIAIFPNPANETLTLTLHDDLKYNATIELLNSIGSVVETRYTGGSQNETLNLTRFAPGVYTVRISNATTIATKKFVITR
ncbi:MAG: choice-of-anchor J domain-containing protein [Chitinophagales bacterium]|nr:choice-of-anchor J domain-containing protein [Chitinophagales bacterium]MDW8419037.1 choice-of-anchor J domain-containing protein [Chitinophagales bacterium]